MISNSGHDERGKYSGGQAGDQTGTEWQIIPWYNRPWGVVLRHTDQAVRKLIAELAREAAENDKIGYDQGQRTTFWAQLQKVGYRPKNITTKCEADCSAGVAAIVKAAGYILGNKKLQNVSKDAYTGNLRSVLRAAGFEALTASKYLTSADYLVVGDILLYEGHHTAINLDNGKAVTATVKYDYENINAWQWDGTGWWYPYGHNKGEYHVNNAYRIDGKLYFFDAQGYCVKNPVIKTDGKGALISISGSRVGK